MDQRPHTAWRGILLFASLVIVSILFHFAGQTVAPFAGLVSVVPIAVAAWFFGPRVAIAVAVLELIANVGLTGWSGIEDDEVMVDIVVGAALSVIAYHGAKRRWTHAQATDAPTGLANREAVIRETDRLLALGTNVTMGMLDLIDLSDINETFGYVVGDELLRAVAGRLRDAFGPATFLGRGTHERFAAIWPALEQNDELLAQRLLAIVDEPFVINGAELRLQARASVTRRDTAGAKNASDITRAAVKALQGTAPEGREWRSAEPAVPADSLSRLELLGDLSRAIANDELRLHYQPIVDLTTGSLQGFEALVRWQHPRHGLVPPLEFIPLAEQSGLIIPLTDWVLDEALGQSRAWLDQAKRFQVSVNIGAKNLAGPAALVAVVERLLRKHAVEPSSLCLEVTESDVMTDPAHAATILRQLKALGVRVEMDDFGTGYSSLAYLQKLPLDGVKIDRSFVTPLLHDDNSSAIVRAAIDLTHALGLDAVAEGIEDEAALRLLKEMGCDAAQGYLIARPMRGAEVLRWVADFERRPWIGSAPRPLTTPKVETAVTHARATVLVVDDEHAFRVAAHRILSAQGYRVLHAATASEALRICAEEKGTVSLLLTDLHLTDWPGDDLASHLQRSYPAMRIMFMSGDAAGEQRSGTNVFLAKPFSNRELVTQVAGALAS